MRHAFMWNPAFRTRRHFVNVRSMTVRLLLLAALAALSLTALAGPPFLTDDPDPIDYQTYGAIPAFMVDRTPDGNTLGAPVMDFNYGIWPQMRLNIQPGLVHLLPAQGASQYGASNALAYSGVDCTW